MYVGDFIVSHCQFVEQSSFQLAGICAKMWKYTQIKNFSIHMGEDIKDDMCCNHDEVWSLVIGHVVYGESHGKNLIDKVLLFSMFYFNN